METKYMYNLFVLVEFHSLVYLIDQLFYDLDVC